MSTYTPGDNEDHVIKTLSTDQDLDLTVFIDKFKSLERQLKDIPKVKTEPDQETLDHWIATAYVEGQDQKTTLDTQAVELYNEATAIKDAGLLPSKYDDEYQQLEDYVNSL
jgi:DNA-binding transcriptional MerR regulator